MIERLDPDVAPPPEGLAAELHARGEAAADDVAHELFAAANAFIGHFRGGLAHATVAACAGFDDCNTATGQRDLLFFVVVRGLEFKSHCGEVVGVKNQGRTDTARPR